MWLLLVRSTPLVLSCTVSEILHVLCSWPHPYSTLILACSRCTRSPMLGLVWTVSRDLKLSGREIIFEVFQTVWKNIPQRHGQMDGRQTTCNLITALCVASRGKIDWYHRYEASAVGVGHVSCRIFIDSIYVVYSEMCDGDVCKSRVFNRNVWSVTPGHRMMHRRW